MRESKGNIKMIYLDRFDRKIKVKYFHSSVDATRFLNRNKVDIKIYKRISC